MITYNHENWIRQAIESVMDQDTTINYKLYVHDDCSTDKTKEQIEILCEKYGDRIVPFYEESNVFSKGINPSFLMIKEVDAKYIAICEGDDFWIDRKKLQLQYDYMVNHPNCTYCFSNALVVGIDGEPLHKYYTQYLWKDKEIRNKILGHKDSDFSIEEMILLDGTPTASVMYRKDAYDLFKDYTDTYDLVYRIVATSIGYAHYFSNAFSAYRIGNSASAAGTAGASFDSFYEKYYERHCRSLDEFDSRTNYIYSSIIKREKDRKLLITYKKHSDSKTIKTLVGYKDLNAIEKAKINLKIYLRPLYDLMRSTYLKIRE